MKIIRDPGQVVRISQKSASLLLKDGTKIYAKGVLFHSERLVGGYALLSFKKEKSYIEITKDKFNFLSGGDTEIGWIIENYSYNGGECQEIGEDRIGVR